MDDTTRRCYSGSIGVHLDHSLTFSSHCHINCSEAYARADLILYDVSEQMFDVLLKAFKLDNCYLIECLAWHPHAIWSSRFVCDKLNMLERFKRRFPNRRLPGLCTGCHMTIDCNNDKY